MIDWFEFEQKAEARFRRFRRIGINSQARVALHDIRLARLMMNNGAPTEATAGAREGN